MTDTPITAFQSDEDSAPVHAGANGFIREALHRLVAFWTIAVWCLTDFKSFRDSLTENIVDYLDSANFNAWKFRRFSRHPELVDGDAQSFFERHFMIDESGNKSNDSLPYLVKMPPDLYRPEWVDGRLRNGWEVGWLAWQSWNPDVARNLISRACRSAGRSAALAGFVAGVLLSAINFLATPLVLLPGLLGLVAVGGIALQAFPLLFGESNARRRAVNRILVTSFFVAGALAIISLLPPPLAAKAISLLRPVAPGQEASAMSAVIAHDHWAVAKMWWSWGVASATHVAFGSTITLVATPAIMAFSFLSVMPKAMHAYGLEFHSRAVAPLRAPVRDANTVWCDDDAKLIRSQKAISYTSALLRANSERVAKLPVIPLACSRGVFAARAQYMSPLPGQWLAMDWEAMYSNTIVVGGTGQGKTRNVLRPMIETIMSNPAFNTPDFKMGFYITDGKGSIFRDLYGPAMLLRPHDVRVIGIEDWMYSLNVVEGLSPAELDVMIKAVFGTLIGESKEPFWDRSSENLFKDSAKMAYVLERVPSFRDEWVRKYQCAPYSLIAIMGIALSPPVPFDSHAETYARHAATLIAEIGNCKTKAELAHYNIAPGDVNAVWASLPAALDAAEYFSKIAPSQPEQTHASIRMTLQYKIDALKDTPALRERFASGLGKNSIDVDYCLKGGIVMVALNPNSEGAGAEQFIIAFLKIRLMSLALKRATRDPEAVARFGCMMVVDEFQLLMSRGTMYSDQQFFNVNRSCGMFGLVATQSISAVQMVMGDEASTNNLLSNFRTQIFMDTTDPTTDKYVSDLVGSYRGGGIPYDAKDKMVLERVYQTQFHREYHGSPHLRPDLDWSLGYEEGGPAIDRVPVKMREFLTRDEGYLAQVWHAKQIDDWNSQGGQSPRMGVLEGINAEKQETEKVNQLRKKLLDETFKDQPLFRKQDVEGEYTALAFVRRAGMTWTDVVYFPKPEERNTPNDNAPQALAA